MQRQGPPLAQPTPSAEDRFLAPTAWPILKDSEGSACRRPTHGGGTMTERQGVYVPRQSKASLLRARSTRDNPHLSRPNTDPPDRLPRANADVLGHPTRVLFCAGACSETHRARHRGLRAGGHRLRDLNEERLKTIVLEEAYRTIKVNEGKRQVTIPMAKAVVRALAVNAARGQLRSQQLFASLLAQTESANNALAQKWFDTALEYKLQWNRELERRATLGVSGPEPIPHPDHVIIDMNTGRVQIRGPLTKEDKVKWDHMRDLLEQCDGVIEQLADDLRRSRSPSKRRAIAAEIEQFKQVRGKFVGVVGEPKRCGRA
jgi:hypothetical protein